MKILLIGAKGQLGTELEIIGKIQNHTICGTDLPEFNITDIENISTTVDDFRPNLIINASAYTQVDKSESERDLAFAVNQTGPANLSKICQEKNIPLIHISTDYVFDGEKGVAYTENDPVSPIGVYGLSKEAGEVEIRKYLKHHIIIRTSWLYGFYGNNFVKTMLRLGKEREIIKVVSDQKGSPTCAEDLANAIYQVARHVEKGKDDIWGTYHYCNQGIISWYDFSQKIFEIADKFDAFSIKEVRPIPTAEYPTPAKRPAYSALDCGKFEKTFDISLIPWEESLKRTIEKILGS